MKSVQLMSHCAVLAGGFYLVPLLAAPPPGVQFTSRVYFMVSEPTPVQVQRSRKVIERQFADTFAGTPQFQGYRYNVVTEGNEIVFSMITNSDVQAPFQRAVTDVLGQLTGRVRTKGGMDILRTSLEDPSDITLRIVLDKESGTKIQAITAKSVPLYHLLNDLKIKLEEEREFRRTQDERRRQVVDSSELDEYGEEVRIVPKPVRFSFMIPSDCSNRQVTLSYGSEKADAEATTVDVAMKELARFFSLSVENHKGTYIFSGDCPKGVMARRSSNALELFPTRWIPQAPEVVPLTPPPPGAAPLAPAPYFPVGAAVIDPSFQ